MDAELAEAGGGDVLCEKVGTGWRVGWEEGVALEGFGCVVRGLRWRGEGRR